MSFCKLNHTLFVTINNFCGSLLTEHLTTAFGRNCSTQLRRNSPKILGRFKIRAFPVCFIWSKNSLKSWHCGNTHLISGDVEEFVDFPLVLCSWYCCQSTYILKSHFDSSKYSHKISVLFCPTTTQLNISVQQTWIYAKVSVLLKTYSVC